MLNSSYLLGINSPVVGQRNPLTKPLTLDRQSKFAIAQLTPVHRLSLYPQLIQTARLLSTASPDRLYHSNKQSEIGWDNWQPIDRSSDRDDFDYKVDRSRSNLADRSSQTDRLEDPVLDFFTTVLSNKPVEIDPPLDTSSANLIDVQITPPTTKQRRIADIQPQSPRKSLSKSTELDRKLSDSNQIDRIEQPKSLAQPPQALIDIQSPQNSPAIVGKAAAESQSLISLSLDYLALSTIDNPLIDPPRETSIFASDTDIDLDSDSPKSSDLNLTQISRFADEIAPTSAFPTELIADPIVPNLIDTPTIINPVVPPKVASSEPRVTTNIGAEAALAPVILTPFTVPEQIGTATEIAPMPESSARLTLDPTVLNPLDSPTVIDPQLSEVATTEPPRLEQRSTATKNISSVVPLAVEPVRESISDTLPITNQSLSTDPAEISRSLDQFATANQDVPGLTNVLPSNLIPTTSPLFADRGQNATAPNQIPPEIESPQSFNLATAQLNLAADISNIDRDSDSIQLEPADSNIPESLSTLPADALPTNLLPVLNPAQIATSPTPIEAEADLKSTQLLNADIFQLDRVEATTIDQAPSALAGAIEIDRENIAEAGKKIRSKKLPASSHDDRTIINQAIANLPQNTNQLEYPSVDILDGLDDIISPIDNSDSTIQLNRAITESSIIDQEELPLVSININDNNLTDITIPAPTIGYATGGYVKDANHIDLQSIATSDTVSAMLTPGEFVINAKAAQENLDLLTHINSGGEPAAKLSNPEIQPSIIESVSTSTDISPTSVQRKRNDSLISSALQREIGLQQLSSLTNTGLDTFQYSQTDSSNSSQTYSSPPMVFRKSIASPQPQDIGTDTPDQWGSIEDLMNGGSNNSDTFSFENISPQHPDVASRSSPRISPKYTSPTSGFVGSGAVTPSDISTTIAPVTYTNESPISNPQQQPKNNDSAELEILAREIYHRLRQRLEIERERHGSYSGNLAW